ncbi:MAG: glycosyltransferase family 2 protein [Acidobacteriales bacterium]|nr:glycosyltransferase family 2 protein [Terriglobales bacterium]
MTDVSVVIVNWNTKNLLLQCIRSIRETTCNRSVEIIVVDNGSSDGSVEAVARTFPQVVLIANQANQGFAKANNAGIRASRGKFVCLVNSDVEVLNGCLDAMCDYMDANPQVGLLGPKILNKDLTLQPSCGELPSVRNLLMQAFMLDKLFPRVSFCRNRFMSDFDHQSLRNVETLSGCFFMARREALETVGLLDEQFFIYQEDVDWCKRFADAGWRVTFYPAASAIHYGGASSAAAPARFMIEMERASLQYWRKHHSWLAQKVAAAVSFAGYGLRICAWAATWAVRRERSLMAKHMMKQYAACVRWLGGVGPRSSSQSI